MPEKKSKSWALGSLSANVLLTLTLLLTCADSTSARDETDSSQEIDPFTDVRVPCPDHPVVKTEKVVARSTYYNKDEEKSDPDTIKGHTASWLFGIKTAHALGLGVVAVDPRIIPFGSTVVSPDGKVYVALDTGGDVKERAPAKNLATLRKLPPDSAQAKAPVLDFYSDQQVGEEWDRFTVIPYTGERSFVSLKHEEKLVYLKSLRQREIKFASPNT